MAGEYVYLLVRPHSCDHPMNNVLVATHRLYEVKYKAKDFPDEELEVWRMRGGKIDKFLLTKISATAPTAAATSSNLGPQP